MKQICTGRMQFTPYRPWSEERKLAASSWGGKKAWLVEQMWDDGCTFKEIGEAINVSRSSVAGYIRRRGLQRRLAALVVSVSAPALAPPLAPRIPSDLAAFKRWSDEECPKWPIELMADAFLAWEDRKVSGSDTRYNLFCENYTRWFSHQRP